MKKIEWITIQNFRGIKHVELRGFGDINIFVGKNNTGKSTVLEAIYLNLTYKGRDILGRNPISLLFYRRGLNPYTRSTHAEDDPEVYLSYIFHDFKKGDLKITSNLAEYILSVLPGEEYGLNRYFSRGKTPIIGRDIAYVLFDKKLGIPVLYIIGEPWKEYVRYKIKLLKSYSSLRNYTILIDEHLMRAPYYETSALSNKIMKLDKLSRVKLTELLTFLRKYVDADIIDIEPKISEIQIVTRDGLRIPLSLLGDGTKMALVYYYSLNLIKPTIVLIEEPENHLHPRFMKDITKIIANSTDRNQIFITTHSLEFLELLLNAAISSKTDIKIFRFKSLRQGVPKVSVYDAEEADSLINVIGADIR